MNLETVEKIRDYLISHESTLDDELAAIFELVIKLSTYRQKLARYEAAQILPLHDQPKPIPRNSSNLLNT